MCRNQSHTLTVDCGVFFSSSWRFVCTKRGTLRKRLQFFNSSQSCRRKFTKRARITKSYLLPIFYGNLTHSAFVESARERQSLCNSLPRAKKNTHCTHTVRAITKWSIAPSMSYGTLFPCYLKYKQINRTNKCSKNDNNGTSNKIVVVFFLSLHFELNVPSYTAKEKNWERTDTVEGSWYASLIVNLLRVKCSHSRAFRLPNGTQAQC